MESLLSAGALILIDPIVHFSPTKYENIKNGIRFTFPTLALGLIAAKHFEWIALSSPLLAPPLAIVATALLTFNIARLVLFNIQKVSQMEKKLSKLEKLFKIQEKIESSRNLLTTIRQLWDEELKNFNQLRDSYLEQYPQDNNHSLNDSCVSYDLNTTSKDLESSNLETSFNKTKDQNKSHLQKLLTHSFKNLKGYRKLYLMAEKDLTVLTEII